MPAFDSLVSVEEWISDHYLTTDETKGATFSKRVAERIKLWKTDEVSTEQYGPISRFLSKRLAIQTSLATLDSDESNSSNQLAQAAHASSLIREAIGYGEISPQEAQRGS